MCLHVSFTRCGQRETEIVHQKKFIDIRVGVNKISEALRFSLKLAAGFGSCLV